jgi:hypothetical protein
MDEIMSTSSDKCPRCDGPKEVGVHDCAKCSRKIAENVGKQGKRTDSRWSSRRRAIRAGHAVISCRCNAAIVGYVIPLRRRLPLPLTADDCVMQARCIECGTSAEGDLEDFAEGPLIEVGAGPLIEVGVRPRSERDGWR